MVVATDLNLSLNLSCDRDNFGAALAFRRLWGVGRLCYLAVAEDVTAHAEVGEDGLTREWLEVDLPALGNDDVIFPDYALRPRQFATLADAPFWQALTQQQRGLVCPVDAHGKAENRRCGPCNRCLK